LLGFGPLLLAVSALAKRLELLRHLLNGPSEVGQLASDARYVLPGCDIGRILCPREPSGRPGVVKAQRVAAPSHFRRGEKRDRERSPETLTPAARVTNHLYDAEGAALRVPAEVHAPNYGKSDAPPTREQPNALALCGGITRERRTIMLRKTGGGWSAAPP